MPLPIADWQAALAGMDAALGATLAALDRYHAEWGGVLAASPPAAVDLGRVEGRLDEWDARLRAAAELADSLGRQLDDREDAVGRWRAVFADWQRVIQRGVGNNPSPNPSPLRGGEQDGRTSSVLLPLPSEGRGLGG